MIITVVCDVLGEENNGTTIAAMNLIRYLKNQGHTVRVLCGDISKCGQENYYVVPNLNFGRILNRYVRKVGVALAKPVKEIIEKAIDGTDVVHIMVPLMLGLATAKMARNKNIPITAGFHMQAENLTAHFKLNKICFVNSLVYRFIYKHLYSFVDGVHYPTWFIRNIFEKNIHKPTPGYVISNGVHDYVKPREVEKPEELKNKIVILSTGRYAREKSQDTLIKAVALSKHKENIKLILAGQGAKEKYYKKLAKKLNVDVDFKLFGRNEVIDALNFCDIYVHPAQIELEGIACNEAIACGKLTIVSDSNLSATREFAIDDNCIFKCRNPKSLAQKIDYFLDNPNLIDEYGKKYLENSTCLNQNECMKQMEQMLFSAIDSHKKFIFGNQ